MILTILLPYDRATPEVAGTGATIALLTEGTGARILAVEYGPAPNVVERARRDVLSGYLREIGWSVREEPGAEYLSDVWNLGQAMARVWADMENSETPVEDSEPWGLIVVDPRVILAPTALAEIAEALEDYALAYDAPYLEGDLAGPDAPPPMFDGRLFGFAHPSAGILLTRHDHTDPATCAADLLANLDAEADVLAIPTGTRRL